MNSEKLSLARELLLHIEPGEVISTQINHEYNQRTNYDKFPGDVIAWLENSKLLVLVDIISISPNSSIEVFKATTLGEQLEEFANLAKWFNEGVSGEEKFLSTGSEIHRTLSMFNDSEVDPLIKLITDEERSAYHHYYRAATMNVLKGRAGKAQEATFNSDDDNIRDELENGLGHMFWMSTILGEKDTNDTRTNDYVFKKCMEELGEMALEDQIANGLSYKEPGNDGVAGEAVDLAICAMDMFALQHPGKTHTEIQYLFITYMNKKLEKWKQTIGM